MDLPKDNMMLLSVVNTKLRDFYNNLDDFCEDFSVDKTDICSKLAEIGYEYNEELNKFI